MDDIVSSNVPHGNLCSIPAAPGIYKITCTSNKRFYIGSAVNLRYRKNRHFSMLRQNIHHNLHLQHAWSKYGEQAFTFEVLELVLPMSLTAREQYWLNKLKPFGKKGFNLAHDTTSPMLGRKQTPEAIEKARQSHIGKKRSPESIERMRQAAIGRKFSPEFIEKTRQANIGRKRPPEATEKTRQALLGRKQTPEHIEKSRQARLGYKQTPEHIEKVRQSRLGKKMSPEAIEKNRQSKLGKKHSPERIEKMRQGRWNKNKEEEGKPA